MDYLFADGELDGVECPTCGTELVATDPFKNDDGEWCQVGFCPACPPPLDDRAFLVPKSARKQH